MSTTAPSSHQHLHSNRTLSRLDSLAQSCPARMKVPGHPTSLCSRATPMWRAIKNHGIDISAFPLADQDFVRKRRLDPQDTRHELAIQWHLYQHWEAARTLMESACSRQANDSDFEAQQLGSHHLETSLRYPNLTPEEVRRSTMNASLKIVGNRHATTVQSQKYSTGTNRNTPTDSKRLLPSSDPFSATSAPASRSSALLPPTQPSRGSYHHPDTFIKLAQLEVWIPGRDESRQGTATRFSGTNSTGTGLIPSHEWALESYKKAHGISDQQTF